MIEEKSYCSNKFEELTALKNEKIKGVFQYFNSGTWENIIVFESGCGFCWLSNGSFWIVDKEDMKRKLATTKKSLEAKKQELNLILDMAGEKND